MTILIDGYNLMFAAGFIQPESKSGDLQRGRKALLNHLVNHLSAVEVSRTTIVFDAKRAPFMTDRQTSYRGLHILFARDDEEADDLIERMIHHASAPKKLIVVTSDLRLRTAANRRRALAIKSEDWLDQIERTPKADVEPRRDMPPAKTQALSKQEVDAWLKEFSEDRDDLESAEYEDSHADRRGGQSSPKNVDDDQPAGDSEVNGSERNDAERNDKDITGTDDWGPFPPGYGEDLLDGDDAT